MRLLAVLVTSALVLAAGAQTPAPTAGGGDLDSLIREVFTPAPGSGDGRQEPDHNPGQGHGTDGSDPLACQCVPYYLCQNGTIKTDGEGVIDIRYLPTVVLFRYLTVLRSSNSFKKILVIFIFSFFLIGHLKLQKQTIFWKKRQPKHASFSFLLKNRFQGSIIKKRFVQNAGIFNFF